MLDLSGTQPSWPDPALRLWTACLRRAARDAELWRTLYLTRSARGVALRADAEVFIPTVWGAVPPDSVRPARHLAGSS